MGLFFYMTTIEGIIVNTDGHTRKRVEIDDAGMIVKVSDTDGMGMADIVYKEDELIFPGFIDLHVHAREDTSGEQKYKEDFTTASEAALNGGVVAFADMPNNIVPPVDDESLNKKYELVKKAQEHFQNNSGPEIILYAGIGANTNSLNKKVPYKVFMGKSIGDMFFTDRATLEETIKRYAGQCVSFHCEDPEMLESCCGADTHEHKRPPEAEILAVDFALELIEKYNLKGKICHASTAEGVRKVLEAKKRGVNVTVEVTPHHLFFDETMFTDDTRTLFQVNPPIRQTKENRLQLITMLKNGDIDYLATDHAPHTVEEKEKGMSGLTHLDTYGAFTTWLMQEHSFTPEEIMRACAKNPGEFMNEFVADKYGEIKEGFVGSLTILDTKKPITVTKEFLKTKSHQSPFLGIEFPGSVKMTIVRGKVFKT